MIKLQTRSLKPCQNNPLKIYCVLEFSLTSLSFQNCLTTSGHGGGQFNFVIAFTKVCKTFSSSTLDHQAFFFPLWHPVDSDSDQGSGKVIIFLPGQNLVERGGRYASGD